MTRSEIRAKIKELDKRIAEHKKAIDHLRIEIGHVQLDCPHEHGTSRNPMGRWESWTCDDCGLEQ